MSKKNIAHNIHTITRTRDVIIEGDISFREMLLSKKVFQGLTDCGFQKPSPIQLKAIPIGRCGFDLIVKSKSGTGKTIVFSVVALEMLDPAVSDLQVLILAPTREIAVQITDVIDSIGKSIEGLKVNAFIGGLPEQDDTAKAKNCHIAVGAPGRVKSLLKKNILRVDYVKLFIIDEADKLLGNNFLGDVTEIYNRLPIRKQIIAASATFSDTLKKFLSNFMHSPTEVDAEIETPLLLGIKQFVKEVKSSSNVVQEIKHKNEALLNLLAKVRFVQCLIFSNYQTRAENISLTLNKSGWNSSYISAAQSQTKRLNIISDLKQFKCRILISTDLTARGIDAASTDLIINYDVPIDVMTYLHRMGRAGRYGSKGICISLVSGNKEMKQIQRFLGQIGGTNLTILKLPEISTVDLDLWECDSKEFEQVSGIIKEVSENAEMSGIIKNSVLMMKSNEIEDHEVNKSFEKNANLDPQYGFGDISSGGDQLGSSQIDKTTIKNVDSHLLDEHPEVKDELDSKGILELMASGKLDFKTMTDLDSEKNIYTVHNVTNANNDAPIKDLDESKSCLKLLANAEFNFNSESDENQKINNGNIKYKDKTDIFMRNKGLYGVAKILTNQIDKFDSDLEGNLIEYLTCLKHIDNTEICSNINFNPSLNSLNNKLSKTSNIALQEGLQEMDTSSTEFPGQKDNLDHIFINAYKFAIDQGNHWKEFVPEKELYENSIDVNLSKKDFDVPVEINYDEDIYMEDNVENDDDLSGIEYDENGKRIYKYENIPNRMVWLPVEESVTKYERSTPINLLESDDDESFTKQNTEKHNKALSVHKKLNTLTSESSSQFLDQQLYGAARPAFNTEEQGHNCSSLRDFNYDHFTACFKQCSDKLWQDGWKFQTVENFDSWYYQWQQQVKYVSDYVRQNIYVKEMSKYQNETKH